MQRYGAFEDKGYQFEALIPDQDDERVAFELRILAGGDLKFTLLVPMAHTPVFGVDVDDGRYLESALDRILAILPPAAQFDTTTIASLDAFEVEIGGRSVRDEHAQRTDHPPHNPGPFEYTGGLFVQRVAEVLGGREAADQWMETSRPELNGLTPMHAIRVGMVPEVLKLLASTLSG